MVEDLDFLDSDGPGDPWLEIYRCLVCGCLQFAADYRERPDPGTCPDCGLESFYLLTSQQAGPVDVPCGPCGGAV